MVRVPYVADRPPHVFHCLHAVEQDVRRIGCHTYCIDQRVPPSLGIDSGVLARRAREVLRAASSLNDGDGRNRHPRQVDGEHASPARQVARIDPAIVGFSAPSAKGETKAHAASIGAALLERAKELVDIPTGQTAALVLDLNEHALALAPTLSVTVVRGRVNLKACRLPTTAASTCLSAAIAKTALTGITTSVTPRAFASNVDADAISSMNPATSNCSRF